MSPKTSTPKIPNPANMDIMFNLNIYQTIRTIFRNLQHKMTRKYGKSKGLDMDSEEVQPFKLDWLGKEVELYLCSTKAFKPLKGDVSQIPNVYILLRHGEVRRDPLLLCSAPASFLHFVQRGLFYIGIQREIENANHGIYYQAEHNIAIEDREKDYTGDKDADPDEIPDPPLTAFGKADCNERSITAMSAERMLSLTHIVASPMRRTLQTALLYFAPVLAARPDLKIIALPILKERGKSAASTGSDVDVLKKDFAGLPIDFSFVHKGWEFENMEYLACQCDARAEKAREQLFWVGEDKEKWVGKGKYIAVVGHGGLFQHIVRNGSYFCFHSFFPLSRYLVLTYLTTAFPNRP